MRSIVPTLLFQRAFKTIVDIECTPATLLSAAQENPELFQAVLEEHARLIAAGEEEPEARTPEQEAAHLVNGFRQAEPGANADSICSKFEKYVLDHAKFDVEWLEYWVLELIEAHLRTVFRINDAPD